MTLPYLWLSNFCDCLLLFLLQYPALLGLRYSLYNHALIIQSCQASLDALRAYISLPFHKYSTDLMLNAAESVDERGRCTCTR